MAGASSTTPAPTSMCTTLRLTRSERVAVDFRSPRVQRNRKFAPAAVYLDHARLNPQGNALAVTTRGKAFAFYNHEGPVVQLGKRDGVRYRLSDWLNDGRRLVMVDDADGEEELVIYSADPDEAPERLGVLDIGRPVALRVSPKEDKIAISNHRHELLLVDLAAKTLTVVDHSAWRPIAGFDWSPDGRWLAYSLATTLTSTEIRLHRLEEAAEAKKESPTDNEQSSIGDEATRRPNPISITQPVLHDVAPSFDPDGKYLYFLSYREFNPVYDNLHLDLSFPWGMRPYLITLRADLPNPFVPQPDGEGDDDHPADDEDEEAHDEDDAESGDRLDEDDGSEGGDTDEGDDGDDEDGDLEEHDEEEGEDDLEDAGEENGGDYTRSNRPLHDRRRQTEPVHHSKGGDGHNTHAGKDAGDSEKDSKNSKKPRQLVIDLDGIERRVIAFPVADSRYGQIAGVPGRALFTTFPLRGMLDGENDEDDDNADYGSLRAWVFKDYKSENVAENVTAFGLARNRKKLLYLSGRRLRVILANEKAPGDSGPGRKSGWIDVSRIKVSVDPQSEWEQMYREAWRLQRDHYWTEDMAEIDWTIVYDRYFPLIQRVSTRSEFSDLVWEMQGELGTSHAYEIGGDYRPSPAYSLGVLGADFTWDADAAGYRIDNIVVGDSWNREACSPLAAPGIDVRAGDVLLAINGQRLDAATGPAQLLVNQANQEVLLSLAPRAEEGRGARGEGREVTGEGRGARGEGRSARQDEAEETGQDQGATQAEQDKPHTLTAIVRAGHSEVDARYRAWVEENRRQVHAASAGRIGYLHIPDMGPRGYAEFHRGFLAEVARDGLIVDVRHNGGGHVSQLLLEKLARRRIGYDQSRWGGIAPYPSESMAGPIVALTNELAGSDGDIFCHSFKVLKLGPLIGKRTWGGVVGVSPRHPLVDGTITTQPEYSFWFEDVGWTVENYGTEPDIEVDNTPQDYVAGRDPQLERAIVEALRLLADKPVVRPDLKTRPSRALPKLPHKPA